MNKNFKTKLLALMLLASPIAVAMEGQDGEQREEQVQQDGRNWGRIAAITGGVLGTAAVVGGALVFRNPEAARGLVKALPGHVGNAGGVLWAGVTGAGGALLKGAKTLPGHAGKAGGSLWTGVIGTGGAVLGWLSQQATGFAWAHPGAAAVKAAGDLAHAPQARLLGVTVPVVTAISGGTVGYFQGKRHQCEMEVVEGERDAAQLAHQALVQRESNRVQLYAIIRQVNNEGDVQHDRIRLEQLRDQADILSRIDAPLQGLVGQFFVQILELNARMIVPSTEAEALAFVAEHVNPVFAQLNARMDQLALIGVNYEPVA